MKLTNQRITELVPTLEPLLERRDRIGYVAARNTRTMLDATAEYERRRDELIQEHGTPGTDEDGNETGAYEIRIGTPAYAAFERDIREWAEFEHDLALIPLTFDEVEGRLSGTEILAIDWMLSE